MAESNADKLYALGQRLGQHREQLENLRKQVANGGEMSDAMATLAKQKEAAIKYVQAQYDALAKMPGSKMGEVIQKAEAIMGKEIPAAAEATGKTALKIGEHLPRIGALAAGPVGMGLMAAQDASASENVGPGEGEPGYEEESGGNRAGIDLGQIGNGVQSSGQFLKDIGEAPEATYNQNQPEKEPDYYKQQQEAEQSVEKADGGVFSDQAMENYKQTHKPGTRNGTKTVSMTETPPVNVAKYKKDNKKFENYGDLVGSSDGYKKGGVVKKKMSDGGQPAGMPDSYLADGGVPLASKKSRGRVNTPAPSGVAGMYMAEGGSVSKKLQEGDVVPGDKDQYSGDTVPALLNKGELVLNVEHQQKLIDKINGRETSLPEGARVDDLLNDGKASIDKKQQAQLFSYIKGETDKAPTGHVVIYHHADGDMADPSDILSTQQQSIPMAPADQDNSDVAPTTQDVAAAQQNQNAVPSYTGAAPMFASNVGGKQVAPVMSPTSSEVTGTPADLPQADPGVVNYYKAQQLQNRAIGNQPTSDDINNPFRLPPGMDYLPFNPSKMISSIGSVLPSLNQANNALQQSSAALAQQDAARQQLAQSTLQEMQNQQQNLDKMSNTTGIDRFFANESTLGKIFFGTALALSTAASLKTGVNPVLNYINENANQEIEAQKLKGSNAFAMKDFILRQNMADLNSAQAKATNAQQQANISQIIAGVQNDIMKNTQVWNQSVRNMLIMQQAMQANSSGKGVPTGALAAFGPDYQGRAVPLPGGDRSVFAGTPAAAEKAKGEIEDAQNLRSTLLGAIDLGYKGKTFPIGADRSEYETQMKLASIQAKKAWQDVAARGNLDEKTIGSGEDLFGNTQAWTTWSPAQQAKAFTTLYNIENKLKGTYATYANAPRIDLGVTRSTAEALVQAGNSPAQAYKKVFDTNQAIMRQKQAQQADQSIRQPLR